MQSGDLEAAENHLENFLGASGAAMDMDMEGAGHDDGTAAHDEAEESHDEGTAGRPECRSRRALRGPSRRPPWLKYPALTIEPIGHRHGNSPKPLLLPVTRAESSKA